MVYRQLADGQGRLRAGPDGRFYLAAQFLARVLLQDDHLVLFVEIENLGATIGTQPLPVAPVVIDYDFHAVTSRIGSA